jgi:hypothetical protein
MRIGKSKRIVNALLFALLALAILPMAITSLRAQAVCTIPGESCADFATNFVTGTCGDTCTPMPGCTTCPGPLGLASDPLGNLYVADIVSDNIYRFSHTLGQIACPGQIACSGSNQFVSSSTLSPYKPHGMTFGKDGSLYVNLVLHTNLPDGEVVRLSPSGMSYQVVATGLDWPSGLASDPLTGDLFLSETAGPATNYIYRVSIATGTVTLYANTAADGLAFGPDGTLYAATPGGVSSITGTNQPQPATVTFITSVSCADGVAISLDEGKPFLYTNNSCGGTITKLDLHTLTQTNIISGGSRGDFVTVGGDDCLYATQSDRVLQVANGVGNCPLPPLGPMFQNHRAIEEQAFHNSAGVPIQTGGSIPRGSSVYDTAQVAEINGIVPTGNVTYAFYNNTACSGFGSSQTVSLSGGLVPNSPTQPALTIGQYSFQANYTGDILTGGNYFPSVSSCGYFNAALVTTTLFNSRNISIPLGASVGNGTTVHDTAIVSGTNGITPTGNVTYTFFNNGACSGTGATQTVNLSGGLAPNSTTQGPLGVGFYSFNAAYSGDSNYPLSTSSCEFFIVHTKGGLNLSTVVIDAATNKPWSGTELNGASAYDTATVTTSGSIVATGTVSYTFYSGGSCSGTGSAAGNVTLTSTGAIPNSNTKGPLAPGSYSFRATYSGDPNYLGSISPCAPFGVGLSSTATVVFDASTKMAWSGTEQNGASAYDTATVTTSGSIVATGTVSYTFFTNGACSGSGASAGTFTLTSTGGVPNSNTEGPLVAGSYSFNTTYSGDSNYAGSTGPCEPFTTQSPAGGLVCITPTTTATMCPSNVPEIGPIAIGSTFTVGVFVQNSNPMGGFMIYVKSDPTYLYPVSAAIGSLVASPFLTTVCVNGYSPSNSALNDVSCAPADPGGIGPGYDNGPGVVMAEEGAGAQCAGLSTCSGMAFNITYRTVGPIGSTNLGFPSKGGACMLSSVASPADVCVLVADAGGGALSENIQGATVCVQKCQSQTATTTYDASTAMPWSGTEVTGASAYDTATVTGATGATPTSSVFYTYYTTPDCSGIGASESPPGGSVLSGGIVPSSSAVGPEAAGTHSFQVVYSGDSNYFGSTSSCEPFTVNKAHTTTSTVLTEPSYMITLTVPPGTTFTLGALIHVAPATVGPQVAGFAMTGSITYNLYSGCSDTPAWCVNSSPACSGTLVQSDGNLAIGTGPPDFGGIRLYAGEYCFVVSYTGDSNYLGSTFLVIFNVVPPGGFGGGRHPFRM